MWVYLGYSRDPEVRHYSSSGGFTKEVTAYALRSGLLSRLIFLRMRGVEAEVVVTDDASQIFSPETDSIYQPKSTLSGFKKLAFSETCAITCLPCQVPFAASHPQSRLVIELLCDRVPLLDWTKEILAAHGLRADEVASFQYRRGIWPGQGYLRTYDGREGTFPFQPFGDNGRHDTQPQKCLTCSLFHLGGHITVADPWYLLSPFQTQEPGKTLVCVRCPQIREWMQEANVVLEEVLVEHWHQSTRRHHQKKNARFIL